MPLGETEGKKIQVERKRRNHIKKHLKKNERRRDVERRKRPEEAGFEKTRTRMRRRWRRKSCGHGCTERDSGCKSTCPFSRQNSAGS